MTTLPHSGGQLEHVAWLPGLVPQSVLRDVFEKRRPSLTLAIADRVILTARLLWLRNLLTSSIDSLALRRKSCDADVYGIMNVQ